MPTPSASLLERRDGIGIGGVDKIDLEIAADATDLLIVEAAMIDDARIKQWEKEQGERHH
jgi:hypothetical protein